VAGVDLQPEPSRRAPAYLGSWWTAPARYALGPILCGVGLLTWWAISARFGPLPTFITFYPAVMLAAVLGGFYPGLLATALAELCAAYWLMPPLGSWRVESPADQVALALFGGMGLFMSAVASLYRRARRQLARLEQAHALREAEERFRRREEAALRRYELLAANSRDIVLFIRREDLRILEANAAASKAYGYGRDELLALTVGDLRAPGTHRALPVQMEAADVHGLLFETVHRRKDGSTFPVEVSSQGATIGGERTLLSVVRDISDRQRTEEALRASNEKLRSADRHKTEFLALLSHELRNPLAPIRNSIHLLDQAPDGSDVALRARQVLRRQAEQLTRLVDDLLDITRISHGKIRLQLARVDAGDLARRTCDDLRFAFEQRGIDLRWTPPDQPAWVEADVARLGQMVGNLLNNALKFTPPGGRVMVSVGTRAGACEVHVQDTGAGIEPADLEQVFEPFMQVEDAPGQTAGGLGLGLALVRQLAERHAGSVRASSAGLGRGSEFVLSLPLAAGPPAPAAVEAEAEVPGLAILVVEDNQDAGDTLAELLSLAGHEVTVARTGGAALDRAAGRPPDVLLCDIGLPDMSGHAVIRALRSRGAARLVAIALTGNAQARDRHLALESGFDAHLAKPVSLDQLYQLLAEAAQRRTGAAVEAAPT